MYNLLQFHRYNKIYGVISFTNTIEHGIKVSVFEIFEKLKLRKLF